MKTMLARSQPAATTGKLRKLPQWDCRNAEDRRRLWQWINCELMDPQVKALPDELYYDYMLMHDPRCEASMPREARTLNRFNKLQLLAAAVRAYQRIRNNPELRREFQRLIRRPGKGRKRGDWRPGNLTRTQRRNCLQALEDVERIRAILKRQFGRSYRKEDPTVDQIAAWRNAITVKRLTKFRKISKHKRSVILAP